jgi:hypothetical protein
MAERYGAEMAVPDWSKRLVCSQYGSQNVDFPNTVADLRPLGRAWSWLKQTN